jgi:hypothetical protein
VSAAARDQLLQALSRVPDALSLRLALTHVLLKEGKDEVAAEHALRDVLRLAPEHGEARQNLNVLLRKRQGSQT